VEEVANTGLDCKDVRDGNSCHYECEDGYRLFNGTKVMKCNAWGEWIGTTPYCKSKKPLFFPSVAVAASAVGLQKYKNSYFKLFRSKHTKLTSGSEVCGY